MSLHDYCRNCGAWTNCAPFCDRCEAEHDAQEDLDLDRVSLDSMLEEILPDKECLK